MKEGKERISRADKILNAERAFKKMGLAFTLLPIILLIVAVVLSRRADEAAGLFEGEKLVALILILIAVVLEAGFWILYSLLLRRAKGLLCEVFWEKISSAKEFFEKGNGVLVFSKKSAGSYILSHKGNSEQLKFDLSRFSSLEEREGTFFSCLCRAMNRFLGETKLDRNSLILKGDLKKGGKEVVLLENGSRTNGGGNE